VALVPSLLQAVDRLKKAVQIDSAVLVEGDGGCGKSTVIHTMAALLDDENKPHIVTLYLGEHTDAKVCMCVCVICCAPHTLITHSDARYSHIDNSLLVNRCWLVLTNVLVYQESLSGDQGSLLG